MKRAETIEVLEKFIFLYKFWLPYVGEVGKYFAHSDCYIFEARGDYVPYVDAKVAMRNNIHFKKNNIKEVQCRLTSTH